MTRGVAGWWRSLCVCCLVLVQVVGSIQSPQAARAEDSRDADVPIGNEVQQLQSRLIEIVETVDPAVVSVAVFPPLSTTEDPFESADEQGILPMRLGGGVVLKVDQENRSVLILTCAHLLEPAIRSTEVENAHQNRPVISVRFHSRQSGDATIRALDARSDLAVLRVDLSDLTDPDEISAIKLGAAEDLRRGSLALCFGNPWSQIRDGSGSVGLGMISNLERASSTLRRSDAPEAVLSPLMPLLEVDCSTEAGLSGGLIIDLKGALVGLTNALAQNLTPESSSLLAIPCTAGIREIIHDLQNGLEVEYGFLGLLPETQRLSSGMMESVSTLRGRRTAPRVEMVSAHSPADRAGLKPDDLVLSVDEIPLATAEELIFRTALLGPGTEVRLQVYRPSTQHLAEMTLRLGKLPVPDEEGVVFTRDRRAPWRGLKIDYPTARKRDGDGGFPEEFERGVLITEVLPGSPAEAAGLKAGQFIAKVGEQPVETPAEFRAALEYWTGTVPVTPLNGREVIVREPE